MSRNKLTQTEVGKVYGRFTVKELYKEKGRNFFKVICEEGHEKSIRADALKKTCNVCFACDFSNPLYKTNTYNSWDSMVQRTTNKDNNSWYKYGAIGITCFSDWALPGGEGWKNFYAYMGDCPQGMTLDRWPNKFGNYEPGNVRWATNSEQGYNQKKRSTNTSGRTGVTWDKARGKWNALITFNNKNIYIGRYSSFEEACLARESAELEYFGETKE
jgi:hypothetical protein